MKAERKRGVFSLSCPTSPAKFEAACTHCQRGGRAWLRVRVCSGETIRSRSGDASAAPSCSAGTDSHVSRGFVSRARNGTRRNATAQPAVARRSARAFVAACRAHQAGLSRRPPARATAHRVRVASGPRALLAALVAASSWPRAPRSCWLGTAGFSRGGRRVARDSDAIAPACLWRRRLPQPARRTAVWRG